MKKLEVFLKDRKSEIEKIEAPEEMESRLLKALETKASPTKHKKSKWKVKVASILVFTLLIGYNFDTLAFYGKKLIGFEKVMNGTLRELNELEKGQVVDKSYTLSNGVKVTLDGIMIDENQLLAFYTIKSPNKDVELVTHLSDANMKGIFSRYHNQSGQGETNEETREVKWISQFQSPHFFDKKLSFQFYLKVDGVLEYGEIDFTLDRSKAMGHTLKKSIDKTIKADETNIYFKSLLVSPTQTRIEGSIQNLISLAKDKIMGERFIFNHLEINLIANGKVIDRQSSGMSTNMKGTTFEIEYDTLPKDLESLQLELVSFSANHDVNEIVAIDKSKENQNIEIRGQRIEINEVYEANGDTFITITTAENTVLTKVFLLIDGSKKELIETISSDYEKFLEGRILHRRTLHFPGQGNELKFDIQKMAYEKVYNEKINIPLD